MTGLELARGYYEEFGKQMLENDFKDILPYLAVGFAGSGSEHYGFDDEVSRDHDFEPGFCIWLPSEDVVDRKRAFQLERAYSKLPKEYMGVSRQILSPSGGNRNGVIRTFEFYEALLGIPDQNLTLDMWLHTPDYALSQAVNGEVYMDNYGEFTSIRNAIKNMPEDIRLKRLAACILIMAQSGQYNFRRCISHGETEAAQLALVEFVNACIKAVFLLKREYAPYYKWSFKALRKLTKDSNEFKELVSNLTTLLYGDNRDSEVATDKMFIVEDIASEIISELQAQGITKAICGDLEKHAYSVNDFIIDGNVRNLHILETWG